jgi:aldehyde oxidase
MPMSSVHLRGTSTETVPNTNASGGSVVADLNGLAVKVELSAMTSFINPSRSNAQLEIRREESFIS